MTERLRILQIYPKEDYFTGAAIQVRDLAWGLKERGHEVAMVTRPSEVWRTKTREAGIPHHAVPLTSEIDLHSVRQLVRILRGQRPHIVHAHKGRARTVAMMAGLFVRIPVLVLNRGVSFPLSRFNRLGYTSRRVTAIVAVCESLKRGLVRQGVPAEKIEVIYSGTDIERFHPRVDGRRIRDELGLASDHFVIVQVGIRSWKGNDDVLDAMTKVAPRIPNSRLVFVGANEAKARILHEKAAARGIGDFVSVLLYREDVPEILAAADVTVDASFAGLGLTGALRESLAVGTPVIGTDIEGNPEMVIPGETGILVPPRDPAALAEAVLAIASDPARARAMGDAGRRLAVAKFSTRVKIARTEALYRRLLAARPA